MISIHSFTFGPFQENTYLLYNEAKECLIIDPGCYDEQERNELRSFIEKNNLKPIQLLNTHCHIDHVLGNRFVVDKYTIPLLIHNSDLVVLDSLMRVAQMYGLNVEESPQPNAFLNEGDVITLGADKLDILFTPGHSPGSICFVNHAQKFVIGGDVLFYGSIGRTDLPGGNHQTLINSIKEKLLTLPDDYKVYAGHGQPTNIGFECNNNPFLND